MKSNPQIQINQKKEKKKKTPPEAGFERRNVRTQKKGEGKGGSHTGDCERVSRPAHHVTQSRARTPRGPVKKSALFIF